MLRLNKQQPCVQGGGITIVGLSTHAERNHPVTPANHKIIGELAIEAKGLHRLGMEVDRQALYAARRKLVERVSQS